MGARSTLYFLLGLTFACGGGAEDSDGDGFADGVFQPNNVSIVTPTKPTGWITGTVIDFNAGLALAGAQVSISGAGVTKDVAADSNGAFQAGPLPASRYTVRINAGGYAEAILSAVEIPNAAGNFPVEDASVALAPIGLLPTGGKFSVQVVSETGAPVAGARVAVETAVKFFLDTAARGTQVARAETDQNGRAEVTGLVDLWSLPPRFDGSAALTITVAPVDLDGDGNADLRGQTTPISGVEVRAGTRAPVIVLRSPGATPLTVLASNLARFVNAQAPEPSIVEPSGPVRVVLSLPIDRDAIAVDLRDELGDPAGVVNAVVGVLENTIELTPAMALMPGLEYNLSLRVRSRGTTPVQTLTVASPLFVKSDAAQPIQAMVSFLDVNRNGAWGDGDVVQVRFSRPIGRAGRTPAFNLEIHVALDLNNSGTLGDGPGELMPNQPPVTAPATLAASEPNPGNGAGSSGFTRVVADLPVNLGIPLPNVGGPIQYEIRVRPAMNDGLVVTDPEGRPVPERYTGDAPLLTPR